MFYAVIHRPKIDTTEIEEVGRKYDPYFGLISTHVTLVFPFKTEDIEGAALMAHVQSIADKTEPFEVYFNKLELSWDQWLFLIPTVGKSQFEYIHDELYSGMLNNFLRSDIEYVPHIALGHFAVANSGYNLKDPTTVLLDEEKYKIARAEIDKNKLDLIYTATSMELISVNDEFTQTKTLANFDFKTRN